LPDPVSPSPKQGAPITPKAAIFVVLALACAVPWPIPSLAAWTLALGIVVGLTNLAVWPKQSKTLSRWLIQAAIVSLGLRIDIHQLLGEAVDGFLLAISTIFGALALGALLARLFKLPRDLGALISSGTAICGGSAIAAVGSAIRAKSSDMAIATAVVFVLNAIGVFVLPVVGHKAGLSANDFGSWAGVAIHDMASVNAVAKDYHAPGATGDVAITEAALDTANVVKLTRVIWIAPIALVAAWWWSRRRADEVPSAAGSAASPKPPSAWQRFASIMPWFIVWFVAACLLRTLVPALADAADEVKLASGCAFQLALFLIGTGVSRAALKEAGLPALLHATILWIALAGATLLVLK
jgi:uncharacterized integral membrane protein (TIGR00698 family)